MPTATVNCRTCGDLHITVRAMTTNLDGVDETGTYRFICPSCDRDHEVRVRVNVLRKLNSLGAQRASSDAESTLGDSYITLEETIQFNVTLADDHKIGSALEQLAKDDQT